MSVYTVAPTRRGVLLIVIAATAWGTGGAVAAILHRTTGLGPIAVSFWRFAVAVAATAAIAAVRRYRAGPEGGSNRPVRWWPAIRTGAGLAISQAAYFGSVDAAGLAVGTLVTLGAAPGLVALGARLTLGERLTRAQFGAMAVVLGGLVLLADGSGGPGARPVVGVALGLLSALLYAAVTVQARAGRGTDAGLPVFVVGLCCLAPFALAEGVLPATGAALPTAGWLLYLGVVPTVLAYGWYFTGLRTVPAATASVVALLEPVTATVMALAVLGEHLTATTLAGAVTLLVAVAALVRTGR